MHCNDSILHKNRVSLPSIFHCLSSPAQLDVSERTAETTAPPEPSCLLGICHIHWRVNNCSTRCSQMWPMSLFTFLYPQEFPESQIVFNLCRKPNVLLSFYLCISYLKSLLPLQSFRSNTDTKSWLNTYAVYNNIPIYVVLHLIASSL